MYSRFKKVIWIMCLGLSCLLLVGCSGDNAISQKCDSTGWPLAVQAWTFHRFTLYETIDKAAALNLKYIEAYPGQILSKDEPDTKVGQMSAEQIELLKNKLKDCGIRMVQYGVVNLPNDPVKWRAVFDFAKTMGVQTILIEPPIDALDTVEALCREYEIKAAIHNHPKRSKSIYWDPQFAYDACKDRSEWMGIAADTGHWMRSGIVPKEALEKIAGRVYAVHLKDLNECDNPKAHDVIWSTGKADVRGILAVLKRAGYQGFITIEYEYNWDNSMPDIRQCIQAYQKLMSDL